MGRCVSLGIRGDLQQRGTHDIDGRLPDRLSRCVLGGALGSVCYTTGRVAVGKMGREKEVDSSGAAYVGVGRKADTKPGFQCFDSGRVGSSRMG